jgi:hypothetical protein
MSTTIHGLLVTFDQLTTEEQREFLAEILHRTRDLEWPPLDEETIDQIADEVFLEYDALEAANGEG